MSILVLQSSWWGRESWLRELVALLSLVFMLSRDYCEALSHSAMALSADCDCIIS